MDRPVYEISLRLFKMSRSVFLNSILLYSYLIYFWKCGDLTVQKVEIDFQLTKKVFMSLPAIILNIEEEKSPF